jgi:hypothetical protein
MDIVGTKIGSGTKIIQTDNFSFPYNTPIQSMYIRYCFTCTIIFDTDLDSQWYIKTIVHLYRIRLCMDCEKTLIFTQSNDIFCVG